MTWRATMYIGGFSVVFRTFCTHHWRCFARVFACSSSPEISAAADIVCPIAHTSSARSQQTRSLRTTLQAASGNNVDSSDADSTQRGQWWGTKSPSKSSRGQRSVVDQDEDLVHTVHTSHPTDFGLTSRADNVWVGWGKHSASTCPW